MPKHSNTVLARDLVGAIEQNPKASKDELQQILEWDNETMATVEASPEYVETIQWVQANRLQEVFVKTQIRAHTVFNRALDVVEKGLTESDPHFGLSALTAVGKYIKQGTGPAPVKVTTNVGVMATPGDLAFVKAKYG